MNVNSYIKNYNLIFVARNSGNISVKSISFFLERFQGYGVLKNVQLFGGDKRVKLLLNYDHGALGVYAPFNK